jgi:hypothetical protein
MSLGPDTSLEQPDAADQPPTPGLKYHVSNGIFWFQVAASVAGMAIIVALAAADRYDPLLVHVPDILKKPQVAMSAGLFVAILIRSALLSRWPKESEIIELIAYGAAINGGVALVLEGFHLNIDTAQERPWLLIAGGAVLVLSALRGACKVLMKKPLPKSTGQRPIAHDRVQQDVPSDLRS